MHTRHAACESQLECMWPPMIALNQEITPQSGLHSQHCNGNASAMARLQSQLCTCGALWTPARKLNIWQRTELLMPGRHCLKWQNPCPCFPTQGSWDHPTTVSFSAPGGLQRGSGNPCLCSPCLVYTAAVMQRSKDRVPGASIQH